MGMYKSNLSPEVEKARSKVESVDDFLARGGVIQKVGRSYSKSNKIDAQKLLDEAIKAGCADEAIKFLKQQGIEVQDVEG
jgi:hypothetical protein